MAYQNGRSILPLKRTLGGGNVVCKGGQRILDDGDTISTLREIVVDAPPTGTIGESTVNEYNVLHGLVSRDGVPSVRRHCGGYCGYGCDSGQFGPGGHSFLLFVYAITVIAINITCQI
ncbi:hypothetical protein D9M69_484040 [compost metagenome]